MKIELRNYIVEFSVGKTSIAFISICIIEDDRIKYAKINGCIQFQKCPGTLNGGEKSK